jgi:hypothetical protein
VSRKSKRGMPPSRDMGGAKDAASKNAAKQEREARRAERVEASYQKKKREALKRRLTKVGATAAGVALLAAAYVFIPRSASYSPGSAGRLIEGVQTYANGPGHVTGSVTYPQTPPAGGEHNPVWLNCGIYSEPVPNVNAVHALEHGAVWVTYDPALSPSELDALRMHLPSSYVVLSPFSGLPASIVLSAWNVQLSVDSAADERIPLFFEEYWRSERVPEPGALCSGGLNASGRIS